MRSVVLDHLEALLCRAKVCRGERTYTEDFVVEMVQKSRKAAGSYGASSEI